MKLSVMVAVRAFVRLVRRPATVFSVAAFLSAAGALFADGLFAAEGTSVSAPSIWALSVAGVLPLLVSLLTMRLWSDDGVAERPECDLVVPVPERVFAAGRFMAAYLAVLLAVALSLAVPLAVLPGCSQTLSSQLRLTRFVPAFVALAVFALPLAAIGSMAGVLFRNAMSALVASVAVTYAVPFVAYRALVSWSPEARMKFAEAPVMSQIADAADGFLSVGSVAAALALAVFALFAASKAFAMRRMVGDGNVVLKLSSLAAVFSALLSAVLALVLAVRLDFNVEWPGAVRTASFSARTREILSGIAHPVRISACMSRDSAGFLPVARLLRHVEQESRSLAGAGVACEFVDPRWDPNAADRLVRFGAGENMIVFSSGRRRIVVSAKDFDESVCASAVQRLSMPARSEKVLFTSGHGEPSIDDYGPAGLGDAARALRQDGYRVGTHFSVTSSLPKDCSVLAVVGARTPFSISELRDIGMFIANGGRLLVADSGDSEAGVRAILDRIGIASAGAVAASAGTTDGSNVVVSDYGDHAVSVPLQGSAVVFSNGARRYSVPAPPVASPDGFSVAPLCFSGESVFAVAVEKGSTLRSDLAIRPARLVVIGDSFFFRNATLYSRGNANRELFLNSVAWLAGLDVSGAAGTAGDVLSVGMDRIARIRFLAYSSGVVPLVVAFVVGLAVRRRRRRRK